MLSSDMESLIPSDEDEGEEQKIIFTPFLQSGVALFHVNAIFLLSLRIFQFLPFAQISIFHNILFAVASL